MNRLKISEYVDILYPTHMSKTQIAKKIGSSLRQLNYAIETNNIKFEIRQKLIRLAAKKLKELKKEQENG